MLYALINSKKKYFNKFDNLTSIVINKNNKIVIFILFSLFIFFEFWILGPYSLIINYDEADSFLPYYVNISNYKDKEFLYGFAGGLYQNSILSDIRLFSIQKLVFNLSHPFVAYNLLRFFNNLIIIVGFYQLLKNRSNIFIIIIISIIYSNSLYHISSTPLPYLFGISAIPLYCHVFLDYKLNIKKNINVVLIALLISSSSIFPHTFFGVLISPFILVFFKYESFKKLINKSLLLVIPTIIVLLIFVINNIPLFEFISENKNYLYRTTERLNILSENFFETFYKNILFIKDFHLYVLWYIFIAFLLCISLFYKKPFYIIGVILPFIILTLLQNVLGSNTFKLGSVNSSNLLYCLPTVLLISLVNLIQKETLLFKIKYKTIEKYLVYICVYFLLSVKFFHLTQYFADNSFNSKFHFEMSLHNFISDNNLYYKENSIPSFRAVTLPTKITPGSLLYNNVPTLDGYSNFFTRERGLFWLNITNNNSFPNEQFITKRNQFGLEIDKVMIGDYIDINMLRDHGVKYYFSHLQLTDDEFKLVHKKKFVENNTNFIQKHFSNIKRSFSDFDVYIYEDLQAKPIIALYDDEGQYQDCLPENFSLNKDNNIIINLSSCSLINDFYLEVSLPNLNRLFLYDNNVLIKSIPKNDDLKFIFQLNAKNILSKNLELKTKNPKIN